MCSVKGMMLLALLYNIMFHQLFYFCYVCRAWLFHSYTSKHQQSSIKAKDSHWTFIFSFYVFINPHRACARGLVCSRSVCLFIMCLMFWRSRCFSYVSSGRCIV